ncbi:MAG TPA: GGDEF domain-containing protein [Phycisphaerales bacterium]|nr:GGDEF domain-containing protein [Phycisphaerales bacterium]
MASKSKLTVQQILASPKLPSLPTVAVKILELTRDPNVKLSDITNVVQNDQALSGKILKTVNSSFYGLAKPCPTISRALTYLGLSTVKSLALGFSLVDLTKRDAGGLDLISYWRRGIISAAVARRVAMFTRACDSEEAFIAALMQDIGMLAIDACDPSAYQQVTDVAGDNHRKLSAVEQQMLEFTHPLIGSELGRKWRLPDMLVEAIAFHEQPDRSDLKYPRLLRVVWLAIDITETFSSEDSSTLLARARRQAAQHFQMRAVDFDTLITSATEDARALSSLLKVAIGSMPDVSALMEEADEARIQNELEAQRRTTELARSNEELARTVYIDALTGTANRKRFDEELQLQFDTACSGIGTVGVIMVDADKFKRVNDTLGHQAGDAVLAELGARILKAVGDQGTACRYGGEEFAIIVSNADRMSVSQLAERIRLAIQSMPVDLRQLECGAKEYAITASFGVAVYDADHASRFTTPQHLTQAADRALYAAKESGRNCVRVFTAKPKIAA